MSATRPSAICGESSATSKPIRTMSGRTGSGTNLDWYARDTVGLYLTPDTTDQAVIQRNQNLLRNALREFLPAPVRTVFITEST